MDENVRSHLAESVRSFHIPRLGEIPDVGLYLEQVTRYVNQSIAGCGLSPITPSMVSNYVKQKIIRGQRKRPTARRALRTSSLSRASRASSRWTTSAR